MKHYLVIYDGNYADEFDVYFHTVMTEKELKKATKNGKSGLVFFEI